MLLGAFGAAPSAAYEGDVHFGLTKWLALRAGFDEPQAQAIAVGNQRVDGGAAETSQLMLEYACAAAFDDPAKQMQALHYPADAVVPAPPERRGVTPGSGAARQALDRMLADARGKENVFLSALGAAMHPLQDAWAHRGVPTVPAPGAGLRCEPGLASGHPQERGGPQSHEADHTRAWPNDALAMARETYAVLLRYPGFGNTARAAAPWPAVERELDGFVRAASKAQKAAWFRSQGVADVTFLSEATLPDGTGYVAPRAWPGKKLAPITPHYYQQMGVPAALKAFLDNLLLAWFGDAPLLGTAKAVASRDGTDRFAQLAARMALWRLRDHGGVAALIHRSGPLSPRELTLVRQMTRRRAASVSAGSIDDIVIGLQPNESYAAPILPYIVRTLNATAGHARYIAIARFRHTPYDSVGLLVEQAPDGAYRLAAIVSTIDL
jgi:hypothetical protein